MQITIITILVITLFAVFYLFMRHREREIMRNCQDIINKTKEECKKEIQNTKEECRRINRKKEEECNNKLLDATQKHFCKEREIINDCTIKIKEEKEKYQEMADTLGKSICEQMMLSKAGQMILKNTEQKEIYQTTYSEITKFIDSDSIGIGLINALQNSIDFSFYLINGQTIPIARYNLDIINNMNVYCFQKGETIIIDDYQKQVPQYINTREYKLDKSLKGSAIYIPLFNDTMIFGVLNIFNNNQGYFTEYRVSLLHNIARYLETAIMNFCDLRNSKRQSKLSREHTIALEQALNTLKKNQLELQKMSVALKNITNSVLILDSKGNISWVNNGFSKLYGYTLNEYTQKGTYYKTAIKQPEAIEYFTFVYDNATAISYSLPHTTKDGNEIWTQSTLTPILDDDGNVVQIVAVDTDISTLKKAEIEIMKQRNEIESKNKDVTKSIEYASTIQQALMTDQNKLQKHFKHSFLLTIPKDIVSGDFFWLDEKFGRKYMALCDCAGHGVPGAFVSMMGKVFLDEILQDAKLEDSAGLLLRRLNNKLWEAVSSLQTKVGGTDGMDIAFCIFNSRNTLLQYAGAYRPLYMVRNGVLITTQPDKCSLGNQLFDSSFLFENHTVILKEGDFLLLSSDGYSDQFGECNNKKFGRRAFNALIEEAATIEDLLQTGQFFYNQHIKWRGKQEQVDDISMVGIRISADDKIDDDEYNEYE